MRQEEEIKIEREKTRKLEEQKEAERKADEDNQKKKPAGSAKEKALTAQENGGNGHRKNVGEEGASARFPS